MAPKKDKAQKMQLGEFLTDASYGSWADEMEDMPMPAAPANRSGYGGDRGSGFGGRFGSSSSSRFDDRSYIPREQLPLPTRPPFTVHLGNLSFDATEGDIQGLFADCDVDNVRIVEDRLESRPKGFGYVEFKTLDGLKKALELNGSQFQGRNIKVSVAEPQKDRHESRDFGDWSRKGPLPDLPQQQQRRASDRSGFGMGSARSSMGDIRGDAAGSDRPNRREFGAGADAKPTRDFGNWDRKGPLQPTAPTTAPSQAKSSLDRPMSRDNSTTMRRNSPSWGEGRSQDGGSRPPVRRDFSDRPPPVERVPTAAEQDNQWRARMKPDAPSGPPTPSTGAPRSPALSHRELSTPPSPAAPATRPKLNLAKRTISETPADLAATAAAAPASDSKASPFGAARPIDTATREKEVEEKIEEKRLQVIQEKKEAEEKAKEAKKLADEKVKEERKQNKEGEGAASSGAPSSGRRNPSGRNEPRQRQSSRNNSEQVVNGEKRSLPRRERAGPDSRGPPASKEEKENGTPTPAAGKQYEILRRHTEDGETSLADADGDDDETSPSKKASKNFAAAVAASADKDTKPQDLVHNPSVGANSSAASSINQVNGSLTVPEEQQSTADALEEEGWSTVSKPDRKRRSHQNTSGSTTPSGNGNGSNGRPNASQTASATAGARAIAS